MARFLIAGLINIETSLTVDSFPIPYQPVRYPFFGVNSSVSGVGYNLASALSTLGNKVTLLSLIGQDPAGQLIRHSLKQAHINSRYVLPQLTHTPQSVILYDPGGARAISTDLKDIQDHAYPVESFEQALSKTDMALLCNINFARPLLARARQAGIPIATDVHVISRIDDEYNADYMAHAHILFQSGEGLPCSPEDWARLLWERYQTPIAVIGLGGEGALLAVRDDAFIGRFPAVQTRPIVSTVGAGDALFSAFVHSYAQTRSPYEAIQRAIVFASYKIGAAGGAHGFLTNEELNKHRLSIG